MLAQRCGNYTITAPQSWGQKGGLKNQDLKSGSYRVSNERIIMTECKNNLFSSEKDFRYSKLIIMCTQNGGHFWWKIVDIFFLRILVFNFQVRFIL